MYKIIILISFLFLLQGCKTVSAWYDSTIHPKTHAYEELQECKFEEVISIIEEDNKNTLLRNSEIGLAHYYNHNYNQSKKYFSKVKKEYQGDENRTEITILANYLFNDYIGESYDKIFIYNYNAFNYLLLGDSEKARTEAEKSYRLQEQEKKKARAFKQEYSKKNRNSQLLSKYEKLFNSVNIKQNPYQNPFAYYISALAHMEKENYGHAMSNMNLAQEYLVNKSNKVIEEKRSKYENENYQESVELFFDVGRGPLKYEKKVKLDIGNGEIRQAYLPDYNITHSRVAFINILDQNDNNITTSSLLTDINSIKVNEFREKLPSLLYLLSKESLADFVSFTAEEKSKLISSIFQMAFAMYGKNNTSTWSLLPEKILVASFVPKKGEKYRLQLISKSRKILDTKRLNISKSNNMKHIYKHFSIRENHLCGHAPKGLK